MLHSAQTPEVDSYPREVLQFGNQRIKTANGGTMTDNQ